MNQINIVDKYKNDFLKHRNHPEIGEFVMVSPIAGMTPTVGLVHYSSEYYLYVSTWRLGFEQQKCFGHVFYNREPKNIIYKLSADEFVEKLESQANDLSKKTRTKSEVGAYWAGREFLLRELIGNIKDNNLEELNPRRVFLKGPRTGVFVIGNGIVNKYTNQNLSALDIGKKFGKNLYEESVALLVATLFNEKFDKVDAKNQCIDCSAAIYRPGYDACEVPEHAVPWIKNMHKL